MRAIRQVILVGHCGADGWALRQAIQQALGKDMPVHAVNQANGLDAMAQSDCLWLVNRALDGDFPYATGIELIAAYAAHTTAPVQLLVSNYRDAQARAQAVGACPGFGKDDLGTQLVTVALRQAAGLPAGA